MKRLTLLISLLLTLILPVQLVLPVQSWAAWSFVKSANASTNSVQLTTVTAGNLIVCHIKYEGTTAAGDITFSDGTSSFQLGTHQYDADDMGGQMFYLLSSVATGTVTYTATFGAAKSFYSLSCMELDYGSDTASFDTQNVNTGAGLTPTTGNITTTGSTIAVVAAAGNYGGETTGTELIGVGAATNVQRQSQESMWWAAGGLSAAGGTATLGGSSLWTGHIMSFNATAGGGPSGPPVGTLSLMGVGR